MNISGSRDLNSLQFLVIPSKELAEDPEEYILGYVGDQVDTLVKSYDEDINCKVEIKTEDNDNKLLLNCIIEDYIKDENADVLEKEQITKKKKRYHVDDKKIIHHLLSELPEEKKEVKDILLIKKETDDVSDKSILVDLVPELPSEKSFQDSQKEVSLRTKKKNKRNVSNSQHSPEVIQLDDDSLVSEGTDMALEPEVLAPVVSNSRNNAIAVQTDNAGHGFSTEEPIDCESDVTSNHQTKQKVPEPVPGPLLTDSYCRMITRAILASPDRRVSLKELLSFISQNYPQYSKEPDGWQAPIENYLCHSSHFVKALSKNFVEGSPEMWILNPATERKMIARYVRGSISQKQVNQPGLGSHSRFQNVKTSNLEQLTALTNSTETIRQDNISNPNERSVNKKQNNLSYAKFKDSTTLNNSYAVNGIQIQKETTQKKNMSAPSFSKSISSMSRKQTPSSKCNKPVQSYSALKSLYNLVNQKIAENGNTAIKKDEQLSTVQKTSLVNSNKRGSTNLSSINNASSLLKTFLSEQKNSKKQKNVENVPGHMLLECTEICDISSGDENESCKNQSPTIRNSCLETVTSNSNQCNTVSDNGIKKGLFKASARSLNSPKANGTFGQGNSYSGETTDKCSNSSTGTLLSDTDSITCKDKQTNNILNVPEPECSVEVYEISSEDECT